MEKSRKPTTRGQTRRKTKRKQTRKRKKPHTTETTTDTTHSEKRREQGSQKRERSTSPLTVLEAGVMFQPRALLLCCCCGCFEAACDSVLSRHELGGNCLLYSACSVYSRLDLGKVFWITYRSVFRVLNWTAAGRDVKRDVRSTKPQKLRLCGLQWVG